MTKFLALLLLSVLAGRSEIEFSGFFITPDQALFSLTDTETRRSSGWLAIGRSFEGYTIAAFDQKNETIRLRKGDDVVTLPLRPSKVKEARATISGSLQFLNETIEGVRASLFLGEEASFPLKDGKIFRIRPEPLPDGTILYRAKFIAIGKNGVEETFSSPSVIALAGKAFGIRIGDYGYSFTP